MLSETEMLCDLWEAEPPAPLAHSRLFSLEPIGIGSPLGESLTSYMARLSGLHSISVSALVRKHILPLLSRPSSSPNGYRVDTYLGQQSVALNGLTGTARTFVYALEQLTLRGDLSVLTMLPYKEVLSPVLLLQRTKVWCSFCYEDWREAKSIIYEPLLWMLSGVMQCPHHAQPLESQCPNPDCHRQQTPLTARCQPGYCIWCGQWLGSKKKREHLHLTDEERAEQLQVSKMVAAFLAATCNASVIYAKETFALTISAYVNEVASGHITAFANVLQVEDSTVGKWQHGRTTPQLGMLVKVAAFLNTSLFDILTGEVKTSPVSPAPWQAEDDLPKRSSKRRRRKTTKKGVQEALEAVIHSPEDPPVSLPEVALRLRYGYGQLKKDFPDLCQSISAHYANYRAKQHVERLQRQCEEVRQAILLLHIQGRYPSKRQVSKRLSTPGSFWEPEVYRTWKEMIQQLGWRQ